MKYFVTGATGFIGSLVVDQLLAEGQQVTGLARNEERAQALIAKGVTPLVADLRSIDVVAKAAAEADGVVHLAYIHDIDKITESLPVELALLQGMLDALKGTNKPFIGTSGTGVLPETDTPADESTQVDRSDPLLARLAAEDLIIQAAESGVRTAVIRHPLFVYDKTGAALSKLLEAKAVEQGVAAYIGDGNNHTPCTYVEDAATIYLLALKHARAGSVYNAASGTTTNQHMAESIAAKHRLKAKSFSKEEAEALYGPFLAYFFGRKTLPDSSKAKKELGWQPKYDSSFFLQVLAGKA